MAMKKGLLQQSLDIKKENWKGGHYIWVNGHQYDGEELNQKYGKGQIRLVDGGTCKIDWVNNKRTRKGQFYGLIDLYMMGNKSMSKDMEKVNLKQQMVKNMILMNFRYKI